MYSVPARRFTTIMRLFICTVCLAFMHAGIGVIFQDTPMDSVSLLMVQDRITNQGPLPLEQRRVYEDPGAQIAVKNEKSEKQFTINFYSFIRNVSYVAPLIHCNGREHKLLVLINSARGNIERRKVIRETWANRNVLSDHQVCLVFVIGIHNKQNPLLTAGIEQEKSLERDILEGHFVDNTYNNTLKSLTGFTWATASSSKDHVPYLLLADDTMFINFNILKNSVLLNLDDYPKSFWMGNLELNRKVTRKQESISYISDKIYSESTLPPLCTKEAGFVLTSTAVTQVLKVARNASLISRIDHFLAVYLNKHNSGQIKIIHNKAFSRKRADVCELVTLATTPGMYYVGLHEEFWKNISSISFLKTCDNPDLDLVLTNKISNKDYFEKTLKLIHANEHACVDIGNDPEEAFLVALISSLPRNHERRDAIRRTWGANQKIDNVNVRVLFVMGLAQKNTELYNSIVTNEMHDFNDIIQASFIESFHNLTLKVTVGLKWMTTYCNQAQFLYKGDDDMFVNFKRIIGFLQQRLIPQPFYLGHVMRKSMTVRKPTSKYFVSVNVYSGKFFPPYCSGGGYIISVDILLAMYKASMTTPLLPIDDAFQGILAKKAGVKPTMVDQFKNYGGASDHCSLHSSMTVHGFKSEFMLMEVWNNYTQEIPYVCPQEDDNENK